MKKFLPIILAVAVALTGCGTKITKSDLNSGDEEVTDTKSACEVVYEGVGYILNADGVLVNTTKSLNGDASTTIDPFDPDYIDAREAARESKLENQEETEAEEEDEEDAEYVAAATFGDKMIINYEDGIYIANTDGEKLTEEYTHIVSNFSGVDNTKEPEKYLCVKEGAIDILDSDLDVVKTIEIEDINTVEGYGDYMVYNVFSGDADTTSGIMDFDGNVLMAPSRYYSIEPVSKYSRTSETKEDVFVCKYKDQHEVETIDLVDKDGKILVDSILAFTFVDGSKFGTVRGSIVGFMTYSGEWISKNAI